MCIRDRNGGRHADNTIDFQEFMIMPVGACCFREALRMCSEIYHALKALLKEQGYSTAVGDEGGFAPDFKDAKEALQFIVDAVRKAGYEPRKDIVIALDAAATEFYNKDFKKYVFEGEGKMRGLSLIHIFTDAQVPLLSKISNSYVSDLTVLDTDGNEKDWVAKNKQYTILVNEDKEETVKEITSVEELRQLGTNQYSKYILTKDLDVSSVKDTAIIKGTFKGIFDGQGYSTVSYTHLDVYKRQIMNSTGRNKEARLHGRKSISINENSRCRKYCTRHYHGCCRCDSRNFNDYRRRPSTAE